MYSREKEFQTDFAHTSEIQSLLPKDINVITLTATANINTRRAVILSLEMQGCYVLAKNPNQLNTRYSVFPKSTQIHW